MENPSTWDEAVKVIDRALTAANRSAFAGTYGWSTAKQIAEALREANLLVSEQVAAKAGATDAYSQQNHDLHRENILLRAENATLRNQLREERGER